MLTKALRGLKITDTAERRVEAVFATFDVKDHDGDVTLKGTFDDGAPVRISAYNHASWAPGALPAGKGNIRVRGDDALLEGQFFDTTVGNDTFETVKQMGDLQEWSYGYDIEDSEPGEFKGERVRFLKKQLVYEVSPVLLGAGIDTRTLSAKAKAVGGQCKECGKATTPLFDGMGDLKALICQCGHVERKQLDSDVESLLTEAGTERWGSPDVWVYLYDHDLDENFAVFAVCTWDDSDLIKVAFTRGDDGGVTLAAESEAVDAVVTFVPDRDTGSEDSDEIAPDIKADGDDADVKTGTGDAEDAAREQGEHGIKLSDQIEDVQQRVGDLTTRLADVRATRAEKGKGLGELTRESAVKLADGLDAASQALREVVASAERTPADAESESETSESPSDSKGLTLEDEITPGMARARARLAGIPS